MDLRYNDIYLKGKEEEKERRTIEIISNGFKNNLSLEIIASIADVSVEEVKQVIKDNHLKD
jgi:predicted HTH domain antitoxin